MPAWQVDVSCCPQKCLPLSRWGSSHNSGGDGNNSYDSSSSGNSSYDSGAGGGAGFDDFG